MNNIILFTLFFVLTSSISNCHSSCLTCSGTLSTNCQSCDGSTLMLNIFGPQFTCVGITDYTAVLQYIDASWSGVTHYFYSISTLAGEYSSALDIGHPLTLSHDIGGTDYYGFNFAGLPTNHYAIQARTHGTLPTNTTCSWYSYTVDINGNSIPNNVTGSQWFAINSYSDSTAAFQLKYTADPAAGQVCSSMTILDITVIMFLCLPSCATCIDGATCSSCNYGRGGTDYYLNSTSLLCTSTCTSSYYVDGSGVSWCDLCVANCVRCSNSPTNCLLCNATLGYVLLQTANDCTLLCPSGEYADFTTFYCVNCHSNCKTCTTTAKTCTSCGVSNVGGQLYLYNNTCIFTCRGGTYLNSTSNVCGNCDISCLLCIGPLSSQCQACANATIGGVFTIYYLIIGQTQCSTTCSDGQFISSSFPNMCQPCSSNCLTCATSGSNCLSCAISLFLHNNTCLSICISGTYGKIIPGVCVDCDTACLTCFGAGPNACYTCKPNYYLILGSTICSSLCPVGQLNSSSVCLACSTQCATCSITISNCTTCSIVNGVTSVFLYGGNCQSTCPSGFFAFVQTNNNTCNSCSSICTICSGSSSNCSSCSNATVVSGGVTATTIYYKDPSLFICSPTCPSGYISSGSNNSCLQCATGCKTCQFNTSFCSQCQNVGSIDYYFYTNSCLIVCPDGTFRNNTDFTCNKCVFFTLNQDCIQQCPSGYVGVLSGQAAICQACTNCTNENAPFSISSRVILPSKSLIHQVAFKSGISKNCSAASILSSLQVYLISGRSRLLASTTFLTVLSVSFSSDYSTISVVTSAGVIDISSSSIGMTFLAGTVYTPSGILYTTLSSTLSLQNPVFLDSYYHAFVQDKNKQIEGIIFILFSTLLLLFSLFLHKEKLTISMLHFVQTIQIIGLLRVKALPIVLQAYNVLVGFSFYELSFMTNLITKIIPGLSLNESAIDAATFVYGSQNFINNFGSVIVFTLFMFILFLILGYVFNEGDNKLQAIRLIKKSIIEYWIVIILYGSIMSLLSLNKNSLIDSNALFTSSIILSVIVLVTLLVFALKQFHAILHTSFHRISIFFKVVSLIVLAYRTDVALLCFNFFQILLTIIEISIYNRGSKSEKLWLTVQKILGLIAINSCLLVKDVVTLQIILGVTLSLIAVYKSYELIRDFAELYNQRKIDALQADASISLNNSMPAKSQQLNLQEKNNSNPNYNSQNFLFDDTISQKFGEAGHRDKSISQLNDLKDTALVNVKHVQNAIQPTIKEQYEDKQEEQVVRRRRKKIKETKETKYQSPKANEADRIEVIKIDQSEQASVAQKKQIFLAELQSSQNDDIEIVSVQ